MCSPKSYLICFFILFFYSCSVVSVNADVLSVALDGYCKNKFQSVLQNRSISLPDRKKHAQINWNDLNEEALTDAYSKNKAPSKLIMECGQLILLSPEDIQLAFSNKPNRAFDFYLDEEWAGFFEKYPTVKGVVKASQPGYSKDGLYAVVYIVVQCGPLCGYADFFQYKNINDSWVLDKAVFVSKS